MAQAFARSFYASKAWQSVRREVMRRDLFTCRDCYSRAAEVHHVVELTPNNIDDPMIALNPDNLVALCRDCHAKITHGFTGDVAEGYMFDDEGNVIKR
jgi:5-methylcytosine-specific restriction endonuclease McrA